MKLDTTLICHHNNSLSHHMLKQTSRHHARKPPRHPATVIQSPPAQNNPQKSNIVNEPDKQVRTMATKSSELASGQQDSPQVMNLPAEIRLYVYELALEEILTHIKSFESYATSIHGAKFRFRGALALLLASKGIRAEFSDGVLPMAAAHCEDFGSRVRMLELDWEMKSMMRPRFLPGQTVLEAYLATRRHEMQRDREIGNARVAMQALSTVKHIMERTAEKLESNLKSSNEVEDESFEADA